MAGFVYFLPGDSNRPNYSRADAAGDGLGYALVDHLVARGVLANGPDGQTGVCVADETRTPAAKIKYAPDVQAWRKIPGSPAGAYVGWEAAEPPGPDDLKRERQVSGRWLTLGDDQKWLCPIARQCEIDSLDFAAACNLPCVSDLSETGAWVPQKIRPDFVSLWDLACDFWESFVKHAATAGAEGGRVSFDFEQSHEGGVEALAANYHVAAIECAVLGLLSLDMCGEILLTLIDYETVEAWSKKNVRPPPAGSGSNNGRGDEPPATAQPSPTSGRSPAAAAPSPPSTTISTPEDGK